jgi:hypothetical protein
LAVLDESAKPIAQSQIPLVTVTRRILQLRAEVRVIAFVLSRKLAPPTIAGTPESLS